MGLENAWMSPGNGKVCWENTIVSLENKSEIFITQSWRLSVAQFADRLSQDNGTSFCRHIQGADDVQQRCLAGATRSDQSGEFTFAEAQVYAVERGKLAAADGEAFD